MAHEQLNKITTSCRCYAYVQPSILKKKCPAVRLVTTSSVARRCPGRRDDRRRRGITARSVLFSAGSVAETTAGERLSFPDAIRWKATMEEKLGRSEPLLPALSHTALRDGCPPLDDDLERVKPAKVINVLAWCCVSLSEDRQPSPVNPWLLLLWQVGWEGARERTASRIR